MPTRLALLLAAAIAAAAPPAHALRVFTEENPPLNYTEGGKLVGAAAEMVEAIGKAAGVPMTFEVVPWQQGYSAAQAGRDTCLFSTARLPDRERLFAWVGPIGYSAWGVFARNDFAKPVRSLADLKPFRVGTVQFDAKVEYLKSSGVMNVWTVPEDAMNPPRLLLPKTDPSYVDLWITNLHGARAVAEKAGVKDLKLVLAVRDAPVYLACGPYVPKATVQALQKAAEALAKDGTLARLVDKYDAKFK